jgi:hypothetical protein
MDNTKENKSKKGKTKIGAVIILVISAIVFLPAGGIAVYQGFFGKSKVPVFGSYDGTKISYEAGSKFVTILNNIVEQNKRGGIEYNEQTSFQFFNAAFKATIQNLAYTDFVNKSSWIPSDFAVNSNLIRYFTDENGKYSEKIYNSVPESQRAMLRSDLENSLIVSRFVNDLYGENGLKSDKLYGLKDASKEAEFIANMGKDKHAFEIVSFDLNEYPNSEIISYAKNNAEMFTLYDFSVLTLESESEAKSLLKQLKAEEITFEDALAEKSTKHYSDKDGKLANQYRFQLSEIIENEDEIAALITMAKDSYSSAIKTSKGYSIFKTDGDPVALNTTNEETINVVKEYIKNKEMSIIEEYFISKAKDFASDAAVSGFNTACKSFKLKKTNIKPFPINYGNIGFIEPMADVAELTTLSTDKENLTKLFSLAKNEISEPILINSKVVVAKCTDIISSDIKSTEEIASLITQEDQYTADLTLMESDKVENHFIEVYIANFMQNN